MGKIVVFMTMSVDGFVAGPNNELDWMLPTRDQELHRDRIAALKCFNVGFIGYPTALGMIGYWANAAQNPATSQEEREIAEVVNKMHPIIVSTKDEKLDMANAELLVATDDQALIEAITYRKQHADEVFGLPGGVRTAQKFTQLGLVDEFMLEVHPVALGAGKPLFTRKVNLEVINTKTYRSGITRVCFRPR